MEAGAGSAPELRLSQLSMIDIFYMQLHNYINWTPSHAQKRNCSAQKERHHGIAKSVDTSLHTATS